MNWLFWCRTGLPLSTYFSAIKLRWMIDNWEDVRRAHEADDLAFGTVESWIAYVSLEPLALSLYTRLHPSLRDWTELAWRRERRSTH
jgi:hypothetical protein